MIKVRTIRVILAIALLCCLVRLLPNFAPIHAADIAQNHLAMQFTDRHGLPLGTLLTRDQEHTAIAPLNQVSPHFIHAILAAEDSGFYHHGALDIKALIRTGKQAIEERKITAGASTITMQLARMLVPTPHTLLGKVKEIWLAWRLAAGMNQDEILSAYINRLPMGGNIYGVEAAARTYFSIPANDLNLAQATLLAAIPNNPTYFNPYEHWGHLRKRQQYVLKRMVVDGYIQPESAAQTYEEKVVFQSSQPGIIAAPHFLFWLATQITNPESSPIQTTIDRPLQQFVAAQVQQVISSLTANNVHDGAALVIDNHTGEVLAYVGSPDYFNATKLGRNDGVQALRQPGSTLKPFVYELALEKGVILPNTILADVPSHYALPGARLYSPADYTNSFQGPVRVRVALADSLNVPAVRVLEKVGVENFLERLHQLGFTHLNHTPEYYGLGLTLGGGEVSLWELARAYLTMARMGQFTELITTPTQPTNMGPPSPFAATWQLMIDMLSDSHARATDFGVDSLLSLPFPAAVKTGTSSNFRDTWTVGFTSDYTVAVWVGNFNGERMRQISGITGAAPLWNRIMLHLHEQEEPAPFPPPQGMVQLPICAITGLKPTPDCSSVVKEYFSPKDVRSYSLGTKLSSAGRLRILSPQNGDLFLLLPGEEGKEKLEFKLGGVDQPVEWWLNGQRLAVQSSHSLFWDLHPGKWDLEVRSGEISDRVSFQVEVGSRLAPAARFFRYVR